MIKQLAVLDVFFKNMNSFIERDDQKGYESVYQAILCVMHRLEWGYSVKTVKPMLPMQENYVFFKVGEYRILAMDTDTHVIVLGAGKEYEMEAMAANSHCKIHPMTGTLQFYQIAKIKVA